MENKSFTTTIAVAKSPQEVFNCIKAIPKWWTKDFEGSTKQLNDEFVIHHPGAHYSKQRLVEEIPNRKLAWLITDSTLHWLKKDQHEWTNTTIIFELSFNGNKTIIHVTHEGLTPDKECYAMCSQGWTTVIIDRLYNYITTGKEV